MAVLTRRFVGTCLGIAAGIILFSGLDVRATSPPSQVLAREDFPVYPVIKPNVDFWIDVFTRYSRSQGVVHDMRDLSRVYGTIALDPDKTRNAAQKNQQHKKKTLGRYKAALMNLARGRTPATDMEKKLAALFDPHAKSQVFEQAAQNLRIQTGLKEQFRAGVIRSGALVPEFKRIFKAYGLPEDLVYLPGVESSFDASAYSKFGAAGIWQFTRGTGKLFMKIGYVVDERRDPYISTHGAARLLKRNHGELGEWPLALTAYNHGLYGMKRAKKQKKTYPKIYTGYASRSFKFASRNFYAEFLAAREVIKNYKTYYGNIKLDKPEPFTRYKTKAFLPADELARGLGIDMMQLRLLNPALRKPVFDGRKYIPRGYELRLPKKISNEKASRVAAATYRGKQKPSRFHVVKKGDTAGGIARTHKVALNDLIMANALNRRAVIYIGQTLRIPGAGEAPARTKPPAAPAQQAKKARTTPPVTPSPAGIGTPGPAPVMVAKAGLDTPAPLIRPSGNPASALVATRVSRDEAAEPGMAPAIEPRALAGAETAVHLKTVTSDLEIKQLARKNNSLTGLIRVAAEETLGHYADWLGIPTQRIRNLNRLPYGQKIAVGQKIRLPLPDKGYDIFEARRYEFHQEILEDFFDSFLVAGVETYEIKSGDTLWTLCMDELEIPLWLLQKYNPSMDFNSLKPRQKIRYPLVSPSGTDTTGLDFRI